MSTLPNNYNGPPLDGGFVTGETTNGTAVSLKHLTPEQQREWLGPQNIHNGAHFMSAADNEAYQALCSSDLKEAIRFLRIKWAEYADHEFLQSFVLVHWVGDSEDGITKLEQMVQDGRPEVEISAQGYRDSTSLADNPRWLRASFGVVVSGRINLASNADIQTNQWHGLLPDDDTKRRKYTEWANRLMTNEDNCLSPYEFAVDEWHAIGIIANPDSIARERLAAIAESQALPLIDSQQNNLFEPQS